MGETIEQRVQRLERVLCTLRDRLQTCRRVRDDREQIHKASVARLRQARDGYRAERNTLRTRIALIGEDHARYSGCYVLMKSGGAEYAGASVNVFGRIAEHRGASCFPTGGDFDEVRVIWCAPDDLNTLEHRLIQTLRPRLNRAGLTFPFVPANHFSRLPTYRERSVEAG